VPGSLNGEFTTQSEPHALSAIGSHRPVSVGPALTGAVSDFRAMSDVGRTNVPALSDTDRPMSMRLEPIQPEPCGPEPSGPTLQLSDSRRYMLLSAQAETLVSAQAETSVVEASTLAPR